MRASQSIKYGSGVGCWLDAVVRRPAALAQWCLASLVLSFLISACSLERMPELSENKRASLSPQVRMVGTGDITDDDRFGEDVDDGP